MSPRPLSDFPRRRLTLLGATGSIGDSTLDIVARHPERFEVVALAANKNHQKMASLVARFHPAYVALFDSEAASALAAVVRSSGLNTRVLHGAEGVAAVAMLPEVDTVLAAITGFAGLAPTIAAAQAGKRILLANKEALVVGGAWFMQTVHDRRALLLPLDSEHNAVFQCLPPADTVRGERVAGVRKIVLTASGGPFLDFPYERLRLVTPEDACAHPVWKMGRKISVDSATMMNKGLEVIEAHWLFGMPADDIDVVIHPQSIVHSFVEYDDGSTLAQLGMPDMRTPIAQALAFPERIDVGVAPLPLLHMKDLAFRAPDRARFPCLDLAFDALRAGGGASAVLNAANEVAVAAFLQRQIVFLDIAAINQETLAALSAVPAPRSLDDATALDEEARAIARGRVAALSSPNFS
ncbi:MAG: 1-deoxy-D-xylulose-5-phosphate reductoisomerase [Burkholderiales bacterium]|jgi:1-deoxy-D-xylulose-5-phosphate reductoisomerase|nr:1-deoxy-D-xylulose-5-phosphate reductoisomerase [Burkholderiales bacterium]